MEPSAAAGPVEVQIVKAVRSARGRQVMDMDGHDMEKEARRRVRGVARGFVVNERAVADIHVKLGAGERRGGLDGAECRLVGRAERKIRCPERGVRTGVLASADTRDGIGRQGREREAWLIDLHAAASPIEVQIVEAVRPARDRQVMDMDGGNMKEETRRRVRGVACRFVVNERAVAGMHVKLGAGKRSGSLDSAERRLIGRSERKIRCPDCSPHG